MWAIVPVKRFDRAKQRLADVLGRADRAALAAAMLGDVLEQISLTPGIAHVLVVTSDPEAARIGRDFDAIALPDPVEAGTNDAVVHGVRQCCSLGAAGVIVVPADVPFVTSAELGLVLKALRRTRVVLVPALRDGGTNLLGLAPPDAIVPAFGADSFARHRAVAQDLGPIILSLDGAGRDIDTSRDLAMAAEGAQAGSGGRTLACLARLGNAALRLPIPHLEQASSL